MEFKKDIENLLTELKKFNYDRRKIERELGYSENYLDQQMSKGGNLKLLRSLRRLHLTILDKQDQPATNLLIPDKLEIDTNALLNRMCQFISHTAASVQVIKADYIEIKQKVTGRSAADISVELDALIAKVDATLWAEFVAKWSRN